MSTGFWSGRSSMVAAIVAGAMWFATGVTPAAGQIEATPQAPAPSQKPAASRPPAASQTPAPVQSQTDPIRCWWRAEQAAVHIGERFSLVLTCTVIDTPTVRV